MTSHRVVHRVREGGWVAIGQMVSVLGSLVLVRLLTEHLDPGEYGQLALGLTLVGVVKQVAIGGILNGIGRYYAIAAEKNELRPYITAVWRLMRYAAAAVAAVGGVVALCLCLAGHSRGAGLAVATLIFAVISSYNSSCNAVQNAARQRRVVAFHGGMDAVLKILLVSGLLLCLGNSGPVVVTGYALSSLLITASQRHFLRQVIPRAAGGEEEIGPWLKQIWQFSLPFMSWAVFTWVQTSSDRWFLGTLSGTQDVGRYAVLLQLGYAPVTLLTGLMIDVVSPVLYQRSGDARDQERNRQVHRLVWLITASCVVLTSLLFLAALGLHDVIFRYLVAVNYRHVSHLLPWMVVAGGLFASGQVLSLKLLSELRSHAMIRVKITTALLGIGFNYAGAAVAGIEGVVAALVAFGAIYLVWMMLLAMRQPGAAGRIPDV